MKTISWDEFYETYSPMTNHIDGDTAFDGCLFETFGDEIEYVAGQDATVVWTVIEGEGEAPPTAVTGLHLVNRLGFLVTRNPWTEGEEIEVSDGPDMTPSERSIKRIHELADAYDYDDVAARDMLADLMHWCVAKSLDFEDELRIARANYTEEVEEEKPS